MREYGQEMMTDNSASLPGQPAAHSASLRHAMAAALFADIPELAEDMETRPARDEPAPAFAQRLLGCPAPEEAVTFIAQLFTRRVAVWWGHECLRFVQSHLDPEDVRMMALVADWVATPDEASRQRVSDAVAASAQRSPGVWLAMATGWTGGSLAPPDCAPVPVPRFLTGRGVNAAVLSALARVPRKDRHETLETFVAMAHDLI